MVKIIPANDLIIDKDTPCIVVTPDKGNLHEIQEYGGNGICFIDIMSPPYDATEDRCL